MKTVLKNKIGSGTGQNFRQKRTGSESHGGGCGACGGVCGRGE